ncbi:hypothetical protein [Inconstantimicrobium porci]|uniref:hypothetical protein n=1 Tax=Inconstantimicrobium porci TaxID=2652291 RepID=UPI00240A4676|nr:hypothetical protein [Inconstantimicrobium porci]MDD6771213.1 hypothetical protein [Inconstantimicrobium porci]
MLEIFELSLNTKRAIASDELKKATQTISEALNSGKQAVMKIAYTLAEINDKKLYSADGFKNIKQYASTMFSFSDRTTNAYILTANNFIEFNEKENCYQSIFATEINGEKIDFNFTALLEMNTMANKDESRSDLIDMIKNNTISPFQSNADIRATIKAFKNREIDINGNRLIETTATVENTPTAEKTTADNTTANKPTGTVKEVTVTPKDSNNAENISPIEIVQYLTKYCNMYHALALKDKEVDKAVQNLLKAINK